MSELLESWRMLLAGLGRSGLVVETLGRNLLTRWAPPQRHYHTLNHLQAMLQALATHTPSPPLLLAVWFHDAIYDPRSPSNEEDSAALARETLASLHLDSALIEEVSRLILLTKRHEATEADASGRLLLDADLAVLGASSEVYATYAQAIRREYAFVEEMAYRSGRAAVLRRFLERPAIFFTADFRSRLEEAARQNLAREIADLTG